MSNFSLLKKQTTEIKHFAKQLDDNHEVARDFVINDNFHQAVPNHYNNIPAPKALGKQTEPEYVQMSPPPSQQTEPEYAQIAEILVPKAPSQQTGLIYDKIPQIPQKTQKDKKSLKGIMGSFIKKLGFNKSSKSKTMIRITEEHSLSDLEAIRTIIRFNIVDVKPALLHSLIEQHIQTIPDNVKAPSGNTDQPPALPPRNKTNSFPRAKLLMQKQPNEYVEYIKMTAPSGDTTKLSSAPSDKKETDYLEMKDPKLTQKSSTIADFGSKVGTKGHNSEISITTKKNVKENFIKREIDRLVVKEKIFKKTGLVASRV